MQIKKKEFEHIEIKTTKIVEQGLAKLNVAIANEEWEKFQKNSRRKLLLNLKVPGFRKGFIPPELAKSYISEQKVLTEAANSAIVKILEFCDEEITKLEVEKGKLPLFNIDEITKDKFAVTYTFNLLFVAKIGKYCDLAITKAPIVVNKSEIEQEIKAIQNYFAVYSQKKGALEIGDIAFFDFNGTIDKKSFPGGSAIGKSLEIGAGNFIPGFDEKKILGMKPTEHRIVKVRFPKEYELKSLADKEAEFDIYLREIKTKHISENLNELIKDIGNDQIKTVTDLHNYVKNEIITVRTKEQEEKLLETIFNKIIADSEIVIPYRVIENYKKYLLAKFIAEVEAKMSFKEYKNISGLTDEEIQKEIELDAILQLKTNLIVSQIAEKEQIKIDKKAILKYLNNFIVNIDNINSNNIKVAEKEILDYLLQFINKNKISKEEMLEYLTRIVIDNNEKHVVEQRFLDSVEFEVKTEKVNKFLLANNTVAKVIV